MFSVTIQPAMPQAAFVEGGLRLMCSLLNILVKTHSPPTDCKASIMGQSILHCNLDPAPGSLIPVVTHSGCIHHAL